ITPSGSPADEDWHVTQWMPGDDLPVVVAARFSLSFPALFSANPLYSRHPKVDIAMKNWFSDGGITSNFPVHFFDSWLPGHPTFGLDLLSAPGAGAERPADAFGTDSEVYLPPSGPDDNDQTPHWTDVTTLFGLGKQIKEAMENWRDSSQAELPGFRDRICQIRLYKGEGGLNLNMDDEVVKRLIERGKRAGEE